VVLNDYTDDLANRMRNLGAEVHAVSQRYHRASVTVPNADVVRALGRLQEVQMMYPEYGYARRTGSVESRAPSALRLDTNDGSNTGFETADGQRVGIISDSFARTDDVVDNDTTVDDGILTGSKPQDSGDLPAELELLRDGSGAALSDEGAAMGELVHDVAPDADIAFNAAGSSIVFFPSAIDELCGPANADVVVDDILFFAELMYQRGPVAQAAEDCVNGGTLFFSAAGNQGDNGLRRAFADADTGNSETQPSTTNDSVLDRVNALDSDDLHDWGTGKNRRFVAITLDDGETIKAVVQWNQPALSAPGNNANAPEIDLDLLALNDPQADSSKTIKDNQGNELSSFNDQDHERGDAGADPIEIVTLANNTGSTQTIHLAVDHWGGNIGKIPQDPNGQRDLEFRLVIFERVGDADVQYVDFDNGSDNSGNSTMYGHPTGVGVISTAAVPWFDTAAFDSTFDPTKDTDPEPFTAKGGRLPIDFTRDGSFIGQTTELHPRIASVDANNTTFFGRDVDLSGAFNEPDGIPNFSGTSAAAPNAAAVAAGLRGLSNGLTVSALEGVLRRTAVDIVGERASAGEDDVTGSGLIDVAAARAQFPVADAGADADVDAGAEDVLLNGSASSDDKEIDSFSWRQVSGPESVSIDNPGQAMASFDAPAANGGDYVFKLSVKDADGLTRADRVTKTVADNVAPAADAGSDQSVDAGDNVTLDGTGSSDSDGSIASYSWRQTAGTSVSLSDSSAVLPTFTAPNSAGTLTLELTVTDDDGATDTDSIDITVESEGNSDGSDGGSGGGGAIGGLALFAGLIGLGRRRLPAVA